MLHRLYAERALSWFAPMRWSVALAAIPAVLFAVVGTGKPAAPPVKIRAVQIEGVRAARMDDATFSRRWSPVYYVPPSIEVRYVGREADVAGTTVSGTASSAPQPEVVSRHRHRARILKTQRASLDICARHRMKKVWIKVGRWPSWRCRRR